MTYRCSWCCSMMLLTFTVCWSAKFNQIFGNDILGRRRKRWFLPALIFIFFLFRPALPVFKTVAVDLVNVLSSQLLVLSQLLLSWQLLLQLLLVVVVLLLVLLPSLTLFSIILFIFSILHVLFVWNFLACVLLLLVA